MANLSIVIDYDIFVSDTSSNIVTTFFVDYQGKCFPDNQWTDFSEPVLSMWANVLLKSRYSDNIKLSLYFMDGPFRMDVFKDRNMQLTIDCINARGTKEISECTITCDYYEFIEILHDAIKSFNYMLYKDGMIKGKFEPVYEQTIISMKELKEVLNCK